MIVMTEATYPGTKLRDTATTFMAFLEKSPPPDYVKIIDMYSHAGGAGIRTLTFYDVAPEQEEAGVKYIVKSEIHMMDAIEGYKAEVQVVYNLAQGYEVLDMSAPAI
jgi:hypothetical protein